LATAFFALQVALLMFFAEHPGSGKVPPPLATHFFALETPLREEQLLSMFFVGDPSTFARPGRHGFSSEAWLSQSPPEYHPSNRLEAPMWLSLDVSTLGHVSVPDLGRALEPLFLDLSGQEASALEPLPVFLPSPFVPTQSVLRLQGNLRLRLANPVSLPPQPSAQLLTNSVVELAIDRAGRVLAHRLQARSGSAAADEAALGVAKSLRFRPSAEAGAAWGEAVFEWHTIQNTNAAPPK
jgi:TonB family protein